MAPNYLLTRMSSEGDPQKMQHMLGGLHKADANRLLPTGH